MDKYYEQLTIPYKSKLYGMYGFLMIAAAIITAITFTVIWQLSLVILGLAVLFYFLRCKEYVEYEYIFTSGDVDIDRIIEAKRRKSVISFNMADVLIMAPEGSSHLNGFPKGQKIKAFTSRDNRVFVAVINKNNSISELLFTPNDEFINLCFRTNPKNVKKTGNAT